MPRLLYVEDNEMNRDMLSRRLSRRGFEVLVAENGQSGVMMTASEKPDIVLMDFVMPLVNGVEAMRRIKVEHPETKVIIMTVHTEDAYRRTAEANGADAFLLKKTFMSTLLPTIRRVCRCMSPPTTS